MAGRGPAPKSTRSRPRDQRRTEEAVVTVVPDGETHGPELPDTHEWPPATVDWWETWRSSPQAATFTDTDWSFLLDTAVLHAEFWLGNRMLAAELRLRAAKFGATPEDRARLKISIGEPTAKKSPEGRLPTKKAQDRKGRLLKVVGGVDES
jgi:hypothetical protein